MNVSRIARIGPFSAISPKDGLLISGLAVCAGASGTNRPLAGLSGTNGIIATPLERRQLKCARLFATFPPVPQLQPLALLRKFLIDSLIAAFRRIPSLGQFRCLAHMRYPKP